MHFFVLAQIHTDCNGVLYTCTFNVNPHRKSQVAGGGVWAQSQFFQRAKDPSLEWQTGTPHVLRMDANLHQAVRDDIQKKNTLCSSSFSRLLPPYVQCLYMRVCVWQRERDCMRKGGRNTPTMCHGGVSDGRNETPLLMLSPGLCAVCYLQLQNTHTYRYLQLIYIHAVYCSTLHHECLLPGYTHTPPHTHKWGITFMLKGHYVRHKSCQLNYFKCKCVFTFGRFSLIKT